ncbi:MAG TPA: TonB-dependent receptor [Burkholderiaceae bacterium]
MASAFSVNAQETPPAKPAETKAAEAKPAAAKDAPLQKVEVQGSANSYDARRHDTATKIVVTQEEILKHGDTTVGEVLKRLPGVTTGGGIRMRGLGSGYTQFLINGDPMPPGFSLESITPDSIEKIEIIRAATAEFSTQAVAGTINIVLKKVVQTAQRELRFGAGENGGVADGNLGFQLSDKLGKVSYAVGGGLFHGSYGFPSTLEDAVYDKAGRTLTLRRGGQVWRNNWTSFNLSPRINWTASASDTLTSQSFVFYSKSKSRYQTTQQILAGAPPPLVNSGNVNATDTVTLRSDLNWVRKLEGGAKLDTKAGFSYNRNDNDGVTRGYDIGERLALISVNERLGTEKALTASGKYSTPIVEGHALMAGWDGGWTRRNDNRIKRETTPTGLIPDNVDEFVEATVRRLALFAQDEWNVTPRWSVYAGLRWEGIETQAGFRSLPAIVNRSSVWSPLFQTMYKLPDSKNDQLRFALTRTYKAPPTFSLVPRKFISRENTETTPDSQGNPNLKPELAWGIDAGYEHFLADGGVLSAGVFARRIEDVTRYVTLLIDGRWVATSDNAGIANTRGIELDAKFPLKAFWKDAAGIDVRANLTRTWSEIDTIPGPNNRLDAQVPVSGTIGFDYKGKSPLSGGASFSYQAGGEVRLSVEQWRYSLPRRTLDAYAVWKFDPKNQLRLSLSNLLHQTRINETRFVTATARSRDLYRERTYTGIRLNYELKL